MDTANACFGTHVKDMPRQERVAKKRVLELFNTPLPELLRLAQEAHRAHFDPLEILASTLVSIKTGACTEDCAYCAQSSRHEQPVPYEPLLEIEDVLEAGRKAKAAGATRLCMGESREDRAGLLHELANLPVPPDSVPINKLMPMPGTPLSDAAPVDDLEIVRAIAVTRVLMPSTQIRLSAGRTSMPHAMQFLCFLAGANGIFFGDQLLTAQNPSRNEDRAMIDSFGMVLVAED